LVVYSESPMTVQGAHGEAADPGAPAPVELSGGEALVRMLAAAGVREAFGVPAGKLAGLMAPLAAEPRLRFLGTRHEAAAAWMAGATFQASGRLAVCFGESGPGSLNLVGGLGSAAADSLAVLAITSGPPNHLVRPLRGAAMDVDNAALFAACTKWRARVEAAERLPEIVREALRAALGGRPGPVHLEIPAAVLEARVELDPGQLELDLATLLPVPPVPTADAVTEAAGLLAAAERPLVIAGGGVATAAATAELRALAERLGAAATATQMGLGTVSTADPRFFGHGGVIGGEAVCRAMAEADVVLAVGCRFSSWLWDGSEPIVGSRPDQELIHVDIDPAELGRLRTPRVGLLGDARAVLSQLLAALPERGAADPAWVESLVAEHRAYRESLAALAASPGEAMHPAALSEALDAALPAASLVVYDGAHTSFWSNDLIAATEPRTRFHEPGMGHLGFGIPYALALKARFPQRPVVNVTGDGAFGFTVAELDTARRYRLAAVHVIHDNSAWGVIRLGQERHGFEHGTGLEGTDYVAIARGFGCHAERVERAEEVGPALARALDSGLPAVIDARVRLVPHPGLPRFGAVGRRGGDGK
jgi:thiamine pyrophosphate-dependent acetolactate synthase large subunit-like protein